MSKIDELISVMDEFFDSGSARISSSEEEFLRAAIAAEQDASALYRVFANKTKSKRLRQVFLDVAREEDVHVGEFEVELKRLNPEYEKAVIEGEQENGELIEENNSGINLENKIDSNDFFVGCLIESEDNTMGNSHGLWGIMDLVLINLMKDKDYYKKVLSGQEVKSEYQLVGQTGINVARMVNNMSKVHVPKFDTQRNLKDRLKNILKMPTPKDDMNAAANSNREGFENREENKDENVNVENDVIEGEKMMEKNFVSVGSFTDEKEAAAILKNLLLKKRNAKMIQDKKGRYEVIVEESFKESFVNKNLNVVLTMRKEEDKLKNIK